MGKLFNLFKEACDPAGVSLPIQEKIVHESSGHPASFMILLKLAWLCRPNQTNWAFKLQKNLKRYMNGTHRKIKQTLRSMNHQERAHVRDLTRNQMHPWALDSSHQSSDLDQYLLNIGILVPVPDENMVQFTSGIIFRVCIDALWPQSVDRLSKEDVGNPIRLLELGLQRISPVTIVDELVQNKFGPQENSFQVALYFAFNSLLPIEMVCLFETKAEGQQQLDLMVTQGNAKWAGYELKVNLTAKADFEKHFDQASRYVKHYEMPIHLVNFYLKGHKTPAKLERVPKDVIVVNVMHNKECTKFFITAPDGKEITVNTNDQNPQ